MALAEVPVNRPENGEPPHAGPPGARRRSPWRRWPLAIGGVGTVAVAAVVVLAVLAGTYQPVRFGGSSGGAYPGMPPGVGISAVNTFGGAVGETFIPPQPGVFTLSESIYNAGPQAVTIEAVSFMSPQQASILAWPLIPAGPVHWMLQGYTPHQRGPFSGTSVTGLSLSPHEAVELGIPLRMPACYVTAAWTTLDTFYVEVRFLAFTHWVPIELPSALVMHEPTSPGVPAQDLTCP